MTTFSLDELCREIRLAPKAAAQVAALAESLDWKALAPGMAMLAAPGRWQEGLDTLSNQLIPDELGIKMLTCCLRQALETWKTYQNLGISREIYIATMAAFSRFVDEHMESFGCYGFDRAFWTVRQLSATLFRIGELEYELVEDNGEKQIHLHIPSGSRLLMPVLEASRQEAAELLHRVFPDYEDAPMLCDSWMLSPTLPQFLPENSRILAFHRNFRITPQEKGDSFLQWVFKRTDLPADQLPEDTSLQRKLKAHVLAGGEWIEALGILKEDAFRNN